MPGIQPRAEATGSPGTLVADWGANYRYQDHGLMPGIWTGPGFVHQSQGGGPAFGVAGLVWGSTQQDKAFKRAWVQGIAGDVGSRGGDPAAYHRTRFTVRELTDCFAPERLAVYHVQRVADASGRMGDLESPLAWVPSPESSWLWEHGRPAGVPPSAEAAALGFQTSWPRDFGAEPHHAHLVSIGCPERVAGQAEPPSGHYYICIQLDAGPPAPGQLPTM